MHSDTAASNSGTLRAACPKCGGILHEGHKRVQCHSCDFVIWKIMASRRFRTSELEELLSTRRVGPLEDFHSKTGKRFAATIKLTSALKLEFDFGRPGN